MARLCVVSVGRDVHSRQSSPRTDEGKCGSHSSSKRYNLKLIMDTCRLWGGGKKKTHLLLSDLHSLDVKALRGALAETYCSVSHSDHFIKSILARKRIVAPSQLEGCRLTRQPARPVVVRGVTISQYPGGDGKCDVKK